MHGEEAEGPAEIHPGVGHFEAFLWQVLPTAPAR